MRTTITREGGVATRDGQVSATAIGRSGLSPLVASATVILAIAGLTACSDTPEAEAEADPTCTPTAADQQVLAASSDGTMLAYLTCSPEGNHVVVEDLASPAEPVVLGDVEATDSVRFTLDDQHVLFGAGTAWRIRASDASAAAVDVASGEVLATRLFKERVSDTEFDARLLVMERDQSLRRVFVRKTDDGYASALQLYEGADLKGGLDHLSASGRTLLVEVDTGSGKSFFKLRTNDKEDPVELSFGPEQWRMAVVGLGDTHNFAFEGDKLVRVKLEDGSVKVLAEDGVLSGDQDLIEREDGPGRKYAHFIHDGNPARRFRDASEPLEALATANATAQAMPPNAETILYLSDQTLFSVPAIPQTPAATPREVIAETGAVSAIAHAFASDSSEIAMVIAGGGLHRGFLGTSGASSVSLEASDVDPQSIGYNGDGSTLLWIKRAPGAASGELRASPLGSSSSTTLAQDVTTWLPIPNSAEVAYLAGGLLERRTP